MTRTAVSLRRLARWAGLAALTTALLLTSGAPRPVHAAGMVVNTLADANPPATDGLCSLREAITNANDNAATWPDCPAGAGADTITFSVSGTILLVAGLPDITDGAGLVIDGTGQQLTVSGDNTVRPLSVAVNGVAELRSLAITLGHAGNQVGGALMNSGLLTIKHSTISDSTAELYGGAVFNSGTLKVSHSVISGNQVLRSCSPSSCVAGAGGGIANGGDLLVLGSSVTANEAIGVGGGVYSVGSGSSAMIANSSISGNIAESYGGGVASGIYAVMTISNTTVSGNHAHLGGGVHNDGNTLILMNVTVSQNSSGYVGGIAGGGLEVRMSNSIVAGNAASFFPDCTNIDLIGPNLIEDPASCFASGTPPIVADPLLAPLADNGGPTWTHALLPGSPALGAGDPAVCAAAPVSGLDQRGVARPQGTGCDLGAYEATPVGGKHLRVSAPPGQVKLGWDSGFSQTGYTLLTYNTATASATLTNLPANAVAHTDGAVTNGTVYCYVLAATAASGVLGLSDLVCGLTGLASGTVPPSGFTLSLHGTTNASLSWQAPTGGADSYLLVRIPLDGSAPTNVPLSGSATSSVQPVPAAGACFQLVAFKGAAHGMTNVVCGVPGISTLSGVSAEAALQAVAERVADSPSLRAMR